MIRPEFVATARKMIREANSKVTIGTVIDFPKGAQSLEFKLAEADGKWLGSGLGDIYSNQMKMMQSLKFPRKGVYSFTIEQNMRDNPLVGIEDVGVKIVRN